jgi:hypothetical protein
LITLTAHLLRVSAAGKWSASIDANNVTNKLYYLSRQPQDEA